MSRLASAMLAGLLGLLVAAERAEAAICATDTVPAATLLLPYFEVSLDDPNGLTTLFSVNNAAAPAVLAHVVLWSDLAVPMLGFDVYLTGYDVQTINLRDLIVYGHLPRTAPAGEDPDDTISPKGPLSQDLAFPGCQGQLPPPPLDPAFLDHLRSSLTGRPSAMAGNLCAGQALGDNVARGYVTVDTVRNCTLRFPGDPGYFGISAGVAGPGDVTDQNQLWGTWIIVNAAQTYALGSDLVAVEADATQPASSAAGRYTFYGRYVGWSGADHREPLATSFAAPYLDGGPFSGGTDLLVWRDPKVAQGPFTCGAVFGFRPRWYPLSQEQVVSFDERESATVPPSIPISPPPGAGDWIVPFPAATQRIHVNGPSLPLPYHFGWLLLDLNMLVTAAPGDPPIDPRAAQAWVVSAQSSRGRFAVAFDAFRLDSACLPSHVPVQLPP